MNQNHLLRSVSVEELTSLAQGVYMLAFQRDFDFIPGQVLAISSGTSIKPRLYSICSGHKEKLVKILFNVKSGGALTPLLSALKKGDELLVSEPFGTFRYDSKPAYWIAAGTGIAPFSSMFFSGYLEDVFLIHGVSFPDHLYFRKDFQASLKDNYKACCSREATPGAYHGRVTDYLQTQEFLPADYKYYLCGSAEMVVETREILLSKGIDFRNILAEIYF